jgi:hypothetical protein
LGAASYSSAPRRKIVSGAGVRRESTSQYSCISAAQ